jgi:hypothetical protein
VVKSAVCLVTTRQIAIPSSILSKMGQINFSFDKVSRGNIFPVAVIEVPIDIKPGSDTNPINPRSKGKIPVAILTMDTFDATTVNPATVHFGANGTEAAPVLVAVEDVNDDGRPDLLLHFNTQETGIQCRETSASLTGETFDGRRSRALIRSRR